MMDVFKSLYVTPGKCISVEKAVDLDSHQKNVRSTFSPDAYRQPVLTETIAEPQIRRESSQVLEMADDSKAADSGKIV